MRISFDDVDAGEYRAVSGDAGCNDLKSHLPHAVAAVDNPAAFNRRLVLGGPAALSWMDVVGKAGAILGREVEVESIAPGSPIPTLPPPVDAVIGNLAAGLEQQDVIIDTTATARELGITLTPAETVLRQMLAAAG